MDGIKLSDAEMDALSEMGNIGTGNAATSLSNLINKPVDMNIPETKFVPLEKFADEVGGPEKIVSSIYLKISGGFNGEALFIFSEEGAFELIDMMLGKPPGTTKEMGEMEESAFKEMSSILTGTFISSLSNMMDVKLIHSEPHVASDMAQALLDFILSSVSSYAHEMLCIKTKINVSGHKIDGDFLVLFDKPSLKQILEVLHNKYGGIYDK